MLLIIFQREIYILDIRYISRKIENFEIERLITIRFINKLF